MQFNPTSHKWRVCKRGCCVSVLCKKKKRLYLTHRERAASFFLLKIFLEYGSHRVEVICKPGLCPLSLWVILSGLLEWLQEIRPFKIQSIFQVLWSTEVVLKIGILCWCFLSHSFFSFHLFSFYFYFLLGMIYVLSLCCIKLSLQCSFCLSFTNCQILSLSV